MTADRPVAAQRLFGDRIELAQRFHDLLATDAITRGLLGPREVPRLWDRHLINCAALGELLPADARVVDVGSGAGLPGLALACARADLYVDLVEPLSRRAAFLSEAVATLGFDGTVRVVRGRAEDAAVIRDVGESRWVTARAVAPLDRLAAWCVPLLRPGGSVLAIKGARAEQELADHRRALTRLGVARAEVAWCGRGVLDAPVPVVRMWRDPRRSRPLR